MLFCFVKIEFLDKNLTFRIVCCDDNVSILLLISLQDGWNASIRYIKNNFKDGQRTDGVKFLLGELSPRDVLSVQTLQHDQEPSMISYLPHIMMTILGVLVMTLMLSPRLSFSTIIFCGFCGILLYLFFRLMISNSDQFVNFPSLFLLNRRQ